MNRRLNQEAFNRMQETYDRMLPREDPDVEAVDDEPEYWIERVREDPKYAKLDPEKDFNELFDLAVALCREEREKAEWEEGAARADDYDYYY